MIEETNIKHVWAALGDLTYAEMIALACQLRDVASTIGFDESDAGDWARVLNETRVLATTKRETEQ